MISGRLDYFENYSPDRASFVFDINADMNPLLHWNVKVAFIYLFAEYTTEENELNQVILWDKIIDRRKVLEGNVDPHINNGNLKAKYSLIDDGNNLRGKKITLKLRWNIVPHVGLLYDQEVVVGEYELPKSYRKQSSSDRQRYVYDETYDPEQSWN